MKGLDKYLTTEPEDNYSPFVERVFSMISRDDIGDDEYEKNEEKLIEWCDIMYDSGKSEIETRDIILRAFNVFLKGKKHG